MSSKIKKGVKVFFTMVSTVGLTLLSLVGFSGDMEWLIQKLDIGSNLSYFLTSQYFLWGSTFFSASLLIYCFLDYRKTTKLENQNQWQKTPEYDLTTIEQSQFHEISKPGVPIGGRSDAPKREKVKAIEKQEDKNSKFDEPLKHFPKFDISFRLSEVEFESNIFREKGRRSFPNQKSLTDLIVDCYLEPYNNTYPELSVKARVKLQITKSDRMAIVKEVYWLENLGKSVKMNDTDTQTFVIGSVVKENQFIACENEVVNESEEPFPEPKQHFLEGKEMLVEMNLLVHSNESFLIQYDKLAVLSLTIPPKICPID